MQYQYHYVPSQHSTEQPSKFTLPRSCLVTAGALMFMKKHKLQNAKYQMKDQFFDIL